MAGSDAKPEIKRVAGKFMPGFSGNPGGRPKGTGDLRALAQTHTELALETLVEICKSADRDNARVAAAVAILDRGWGKPVQEVKQAQEEREQLSRLSDAELIAIALGKEAEAATESKPA